MVGNGVTNWKLDCNPAFIDMTLAHSIIPQSFYDEIKKNNCTFSDFGDENPACADNSTLATRFNNLTNNVNIYDIFGTCYGASNSSSFYGSKDVGFQMIKGKLVPYKKTTTFKQYTPWIKDAPAADVPPCTFSQGTIEYLKDKEVRAQLHVPDEIQDWALCREIQYDSLKIGS